MRLSELLPAPRAVDWDGNGAAGAQDEWIELYNAARTDVDLGGWVLDTGQARSARPYRIPAGTTLRPGMYVSFCGRLSDLSLDDGGGQVRLLDPKGRLIDAVAYPELTPDVSYSRDGGSAWHGNWLPSPNKENLPPS